MSLKLKNSIAVIGGGISGVTTGNILQKKGHEVTIYEKAQKPGGLIQCDRINGHLFHRTGGHVFNAKDKVVNDWFWSHFNKEKEFIQARRNAKILLNDKLIGYPVENSLYLLDKPIVKQVLTELLQLQLAGEKDPFSHPNFELFLKNNFGETLYKIYFKPYNEKIWNCDLKQIPLSWLEGKLPMPNYMEILLSNIMKEEESSMVHSSFFYPKEGGSQFIIDRLSTSLKFECNQPVSTIAFRNGKWLIHGKVFDQVVYTGDIRALYNMIDIDQADVKKALTDVVSFKSNGTSNMLCETDDTDLSWLYLPESNTRAHRIIYTGNFSSTNNGGNLRKSCVVEFSGKVSEVEMAKELATLPGNLKPITYNYEPNSYVIQENNTRDRVNAVKIKMKPLGFYLTGRFAEWEYYNMDKAIKAALDLFWKDII